MSDGHSPSGWSADGNWFWDGLTWNDAVSPDGKWRFDGREWEAFHGQRSPMPEQALHPIAPPPQPAPSVAAALPSWVAVSEIERLDQERREREELAAKAALPQVPLPPELDWRRVGEHMTYSRPVRTYSDWQVGPVSVALYILLYLVCWPASLIFLWRAGWRGRTKLFVFVLSIVGAFVLALLAIGLGAGRPR
jgi:hypothetical protein